MCRGFKRRGEGKGKTCARARTEVNVPGKNTMVSNAIPFMDELSRFMSLAISILFAASCCVTRLKTRLMAMSFRSR